MNEKELQELDTQIDYLDKKYNGLINEFSETMKHYKKKAIEEIKEKFKEKCSNNNFQLDDSLIDEIKADKENLQYIIHFEDKNNYIYKKHKVNVCLYLLRFINDGIIFCINYSGDNELDKKITKIYSYKNEIQKFEVFIEQLKSDVITIEYLEVPYSGKPDNNKIKKIQEKYKRNRFSKIDINNLVEHG
jgi:hypothetical protein